MIIYKKKKINFTNISIMNSTRFNNLRYIFLFTQFIILKQTLNLDVASVYFGFFAIIIFLLLLVFSFVNLYTQKELSQVQQKLFSCVFYFILYVEIVALPYNGIITWLCITLLIGCFFEISTQIFIKSIISFKASQLIFFLIYFLFIFIPIAILKLLNLQLVIGVFLIIIIQWFIVSILDCVSHKYWFICSCALIFLTGSFFKVISPERVGILALMAILVLSVKYLSNRSSINTWKILQILKKINEDDVTIENHFVKEFWLFDCLRKVVFLNSYGFMLHFQEILSAIDNNYDYISVAVLLHLLILLFFIVIRIFIIIFCNDPVKLKLLQVCKSCFQGAGAVGVIAGFMHITSTTPHLLTPIKHPWVYSYQKQIQGWSYRSVSEGLCGLEFERLHPGVKVLVDEEGFIDPAQCRISNNNVLKQTYNSAVPRFVPKFVPEPLHPPVEKK